MSTTGNKAELLNRLDDAYPDRKWVELGSLQTNPRAKVASPSKETATYDHVKQTETADVQAEEAPNVTIKLLAKNYCIYNKKL